MFVKIIRAATRLKILIAIKHEIKIINCDYSLVFVAQNNSIIHDTTSIARCKCRQNVLTTEIEIKTPIKST